MQLTERQEKLLEFVKIQHGEQKRKYTGEPYWNHVVSVATIVSEYEADCVEIALCHDLFEDTDTNFDSLYKFLTNNDYSRDEAYIICTCVNELTDKFTTEDFPYLNRKKRKENEAKRLGTISYKSQSVKYADLIDNTSSIMDNDEGFGRVYLEEKERIILTMTEGNETLFNLCKSQIIKHKQTS